MIIKNILENLQDNKIIESMSEFQEKFFESKLGKVVDIGINCGIRTICPNLIEEQVIDIKDALLENGILGGLEEISKSAKEIFKSVEGIITGEFDNISEIEVAVKKGGLIDVFSNILDYSITQAKEKGKLENDVAKSLMKEKNILLKDINKSISNELLSEQKTIKKLGEYCNEWREAYDKKNIEDVEKIYKKIEKQIKKVMPIESVIKECKKIENLYNLVKNNNGNFNITNEELELANKLV